jgi:hypothetical protein
MPELHQQVDQSNEYTDAELSDVIDSVSAAIASSMLNGEKADNAKKAAEETKMGAYASAHNVFESFGLDRDAKATEYRQNGPYCEFQRDCCIAISKKLKDPVTSTKRGDNQYSPRVKKAWSRLVVAYRENNEDTTQSESDVRNKITAAFNAKINKEKAAVFDTLVQALRDENTTSEELDVLHGRCVALADAIDARS